MRSISSTATAPQQKVTFGIKPFLLISSKNLSSALIILISNYNRTIIINKIS